MWQKSKVERDKMILMVECKTVPIYWETWVLHSLFCFWTVVTGSHKYTSPPGVELVPTWWGCYSASYSIRQSGRSRWNGWVRSRCEVITWCAARYNMFFVNILNDVMWSITHWVLYEFSPFEFLWNCLDLQLYSFMSFTMIRMHIS